MTLNNESLNFPITTSLDISFNEVEDRLIIDAHTKAHGNIKMLLTRRIILTILDFYQKEILKKQTLTDLSIEFQQALTQTEHHTEHLYQYGKISENKRRETFTDLTEDAPFLISQVHLKFNEEVFFIAFSGSQIVEKVNCKSETYPAVALNLTKPESMLVIGLIIQKTFKANWGLEDRYIWAHHSANPHYLEGRVLN